MPTNKARSKLFFSFEDLFSKAVAGVKGGMSDQHPFDTLIGWFTLLRKGQQKESAIAVKLDSLIALESVPLYALFFI